MRLLLDTNIVIPLLRQELGRLPADLRDLLSGPHHFACSTVTLWEMAIKSRLGKLPLPVGVGALVTVIEAVGAEIMPMIAEHVIAELEVLPATKDPFDRLLLAQCQVETMQLVTLDRALAGHPFAWRPAAA